MPQVKHYFALLIVGLTIACGSAGNKDATQSSLTTGDASPDGIWERVVNAVVFFDKTVIKVKPNTFTLYRLKANVVDDLLKRAPKEYAEASNDIPVIMSLPRPDGTFVRFRIEESPIMEPGLAKRFPLIKTYRGRGVDDPTATTRFEKTSQGFHAMVLSPSGAFFVDAIGKANQGLYVSYFKRSLPDDPDHFACKRVLKTPAVHVRARKRSQATPQATPQAMPQATPQASSVGVMRTYRIAVAATHRYVEAIHNLSDPTEPAIDPLEEALIAITRTMNRVNLIFESDVGIRLVLINEEAGIIHTDAGTDPYDDNADADDLLELNRTELNARIHPDNYDIGHLFIVPPKGVGVAGQPSVCSYYKAWGLSGSPNPTGNGFDVQYVAHEIGHQFGASHSFSGTTAGCGEDGNRNWRTAYEPGSGSTIMGYSSATLICGPETIQTSSDPYFHAISLKEIRDFVTDSGSDGGNLCAQKLETSNRFAPQVSAGQDFKVPARTPFALTVQSSSDGDGDPLTFTWEEFNRGPENPPDPETPNDIKKKKPLFRSRPSSANMSRIFPAMNFIMNPPTIYVAEALPANTRIMVFRITARDGRGLYGFDDTRVEVKSRSGGADVGPFEITQPGGGAVWPRGSTQTVSWSVARTDKTPIGCNRVRILFVIREDENHPIVLAPDVANNGTAQVRLPTDLPLTTTGRIKVEAIGNIFFNVSTSDIQIVEP